MFFSNINTIYSLQFKIGFEFQEDHHLCNWAKELINVQKQPIITAYDEDNSELWHLEIDGQDIEFITSPFTKRDQLEKSIKSIEISYRKISSLINHKKGENKKISIKEWFDGILDLDDTINRLTKLLESNPDNTPVRRQVEKLNIEKAGLVTTLRKNGIILTYNNVIYEKIKDYKFNTSLGWKPSFTPQVTIQHGLENTIPLVVILSDTKTLAHLLQALPNYNPQQTFDLSYFNKENGLIFLHALTCASIPHYKNNANNNNLESLDKIKV